MRISARNPCQITAQHKNGERRAHQNGAYPKAPVAVHAPPVRSWVRLAVIAAIAFGIVLVSGHFVLPGCREVAEARGSPFGTIAQKSSQSGNQLEWSHLLARSNWCDGGLWRSCRERPVISQREIYDGAAQDGNAVGSEQMHVRPLHQDPHEREIAKHGHQSIGKMKTN